jgi:hypothetical protein
MHFMGPPPIGFLLSTPWVERRNLGHGRNDQLVQNYLWWEIPPSIIIDNTIAVEYHDNENDL